MEVTEGKMAELDLAWDRVAELQQVVDEVNFLALVEAQQADAVQLLTLQCRELESLLEIAQEDNRTLEDSIVQLQNGTAYNILAERLAEAEGEITDLRRLARTGDE